MNSTILTLHELELAREQYCALLEGAMTMPDRDTQLATDDAAMWQAAYSDKCDAVEQLQAELDAARQGRNYWRQWCKWFWASRSVIRDGQTIERNLRKQAEAERDAARRWARIWKQLCKKMGFVIRNYRTGKIYQVQQERIKTLEQENQHLQRVILAAYDYVSGTFMETGPLKELCNELARKGTP